MKKAVGKNLRANVTNIPATNEAKELMPLQHLMQEDSVEESSECKAQDESCPKRRSNLDPKSHIYYPVCRVHRGCNDAVNEQPWREARYFSLWAADSDRPLRLSAATRRHPECYLRSSGSAWRAVRQVSWS
ncbi:MAG: hypothetical protein QOJ04_1733, partial [Caballeronia sp.]|nr:hypothetical protein [Caballeronia sp.]